MRIPTRSVESEPEVLAPLAEEEPEEAPRPRSRSRREEDDDEPRPRSRKKQEEDDEPPRRISTEQDEDEEVRNHGGGSLSPKDEFFADPPEEIGKVFSAHTTLRKGTEPMAPGARLTWAIVAGGVGLAIGLVIALAIKKAPVLQLFIPLSLGGLGLGIVLWATRFKHHCTYTGSEGVARFSCSGSREQVSEEVFCFKDAFELRTTQTRHYTNGVYQGTNYSFVWTDIGGRTRFTIMGAHKSEQGTPPAKDRYHFAVASERAWTIYLLDQVQAQLKTSGTIHFGLGGKNWVKLSERYISLHMSGTTTECDSDDIAEVRIYQGMVEVRRKDAQEGWFSSKGIFKFPYGSLGNAQLFLILMDKVVEVPIN